MMDNLLPSGEKPDMEVGMGLANKLEEMRKEGGDQWLSIWNADSTKVVNTTYLHHICADGS